MKKSLLLFSILFAAFFGSAQSYQLDWFKTIDLVPAKPGPRIVVMDKYVDDQGNVYSFGHFRDTVDFDPGAGQFIMSSYYSTAFGGYFFSDLFLQKLDSNGTFIWAKKFGASAFLNIDLSGDLDMDENGDLIFVSQGHTASPSGIEQMAYVYKIHESGNVIWSRGLGGGYMASGSSEGRGLAIDSLNNIYVTGIFKDTNDFSGTTLISTSTYKPGVFLAKLDITGHMEWVKSIQGTSQLEVSALDRDPNGNLYITGYFSDSLDADPGAASYNLTSVNHRDVYVAKYDSVGDFVWAKSFGSSASGGSESDKGYDLKIDHSNNVVVVGKVFSGTIDFDPGVDTFNLTSSGGADIFVEKLDVDGNFIWAKLMGGYHQYDEAYSVAIDSYDNIFISGRYSGTVDFDPAPLDVHYLFGNGSAFSGFVEELTPNGDFVWVESVAGSDQTQVMSLFVDKNDVLYASGFFGGTVDFDWSSGVNEGNSISRNNVFILKLTNPYASILEKDVVENGLHVYPNPTNGYLTVELADKQDVTVKVVNVNGQIVFEEKGINEPMYSFTFEGEKGFYFLEVTANGKRQVQKLIKE